MQCFCHWQAFGRPVYLLQRRCATSRWLAQARHVASVDRCGRVPQPTATQLDCPYRHSRLPLHLQSRPHPKRRCPHSSTCRAASSAAAELEAAPAAEPGTGNAIALLRARGLIQDTTSDALEEVAASGALSVYLGFDPTAESLHLGHLLGIVVLTWFQRCGHQPIALLGGATGRVGDPSGRSTERPVLSEEVLERNVAGIRATLQRLISDASGAGPAPVILNNLEWFRGVGLLEFLRDVGKYARVGTMLSRDSVRSRMELDNEGMSYTEFTYQLLQGYDFVHLNREHGVRLQIGGSDQMGNIITGLELLRRMGGAAAASAAGSSSNGSTGSSSNGAEAAEAGAAERAEPCFGLTFPLLTKSDGTKMGKSASGAVWLSADSLSPFQFYQYLLTSVGDADVCSFLRKLTFLPLQQIAEVEASMAQPGYAPNTAQRLLASEVTRFVHGEGGLQQALRATEALAPGSETKLDAETLEAAAGSAPSAELPYDQVVGCALVDVMAAVKLQDSKAAGKRLIKGGGVRVNNERVSDEQHALSEGDLIDGRLMLIAAGKKNKLLLRVLR